MSTINHLLWVDLETTGIVHIEDRILEVGCILTAPDLTPLDNGEFQAVVDARTDTEIATRLNATEKVVEMHRESGLLDAIQEPTGVSIQDIEKSLISWMSSHQVVQNQVALAGSGVGHFDQLFISYWMPSLFSMFHYRTLDIGSVRSFHNMWIGTEVSNANDGKTHRAMDDIQCSLKEATAFRDLWLDKLA